MPEPGTNPATAKFAVSRKKRLRFLGLTSETVIKSFFGGNAAISIVVLALITFSLLREGIGFFGQNRENLEVYRRAGLEYVDFIRVNLDGHTALTRYLSDLRLRQIQYHQNERGLNFHQASEALAPFDAFEAAYADAAGPVRGLLNEATDEATRIKEKFLVANDEREAQRQFLAAGKADEAAAIQPAIVDFGEELRRPGGLLSMLPAYRDASRTFADQLAQSLPKAPPMPTPELQARLDRFKALSQEYLAGFPTVIRNLEAWDFNKPVPAHQSFTAFIFGRQWLTASFWQDWYGIIPLATGSLMVSLVALVLAVPLGVGAAIYVNQVATRREQKLIKPCIEFISAVPSVVLGFFGIAVLGEALRVLSGKSWLSWVPGFPYSERLNILTAGCLLGLIAVPIIFTLAEDAVNNVPRAMREASYALGASRLQTILRIIVPASLSGIISAVLLGFGRVIGETMVVLLCAGNRIAIPDFTAGVAVLTQPVHTMTGIIAQEMGEVARGTIHFRALFMVGLVLFTISLLVNYVAQKIVRRYRISIG